MKIIETASDVTSTVLSHAEAVWDSWFADEAKINWEEFIDKLSEYGNSADDPYDFESYDSPAVRKIQRHVRTLRVE